MISLIKMFPEAFKALHYVEEEEERSKYLRGHFIGKSNQKALQEYMATCFASLLKNVTSFSDKHDIEMIVRNDNDFVNLVSIAKLAKKMVDKKKHTSHPLIYRLLKLLGIWVGCGDNPRYLTRIVLSSLFV
ncbi:hypothetical protein Tco_0751229 [Tanacetum coccineum]|uniref:Uncharacterized protein n=1 Tax=Tanacetum coccineum TaxID=301880 RepID=A0ABQ4Z3G2_9ASTR